MKTYTSDKIVAYLTLISGLSISAVAVYYSVAGLVSIFAAAVIPIIVMGVALEVSKLVATVWVKLNWSRAPRLIKFYLCTAIAVLMLITSMGIFGYLSKAHLDQAVPTGDVADKVALIDEKIKTQKENVDAARRALKQMDESVDQIMARSQDEKGADKAAALRRGQQRERGNLQNDISKAQSAIASLNEERAPIAKELRKVEAEVGPIKYIAALLYGDNPDSNLLEKAVRAVIIIIVLVFDPLAVVLLLASQYSFAWFRKDAEEELNRIDGPLEKSTEVVDTQLPEVHPDEGTVEELDNAPWPFPVANSDKFLVEEQDQQHCPKCDTVLINASGIGLFCPNRDCDVLDGPDGSIEIIFPDDNPLEEAEVEEPEIDLDEEDEDDHTDTDEIKAAKAKWKAENPHTTLKEQRRLVAAGKINEHPWEKYLEAKADFSDDEAAEEAAKWAQEQIDLKKKGSELDGESGLRASSENLGEIGYTQNAEQNTATLWNKLKQAKE
jgi:uncharacterized Zn finger protein (UPF0148 family)